jgi:hypothetical protein
MKLNEAINILHLNKKYNINNLHCLTNEELRKQYHILALDKHPDKNDNIDYDDEFKNINIAYETIKKYIQLKNSEDFNDYQNSSKNSNDNDSNYNFIELVLKFIKLLNNYSNDNINNFKHECYEYTNVLLESFFMDMDFYKLKYFIWILNNETIIKNYINFNNNINIDYIKNFLYNKINKYEIIIIKPSLYQIYNSYIHKLDICNNNIIIPLWHKELIIDKYIIKIEPELSNNILIDEDNNIHYNIKDNIYNIIVKYYEKKIIPINIDNIIKFDLPIERIIIKENLSITFYNIGIPIIDNKNILNNKKKSNIILHFNL